MAKIRREDIAAADRFLNERDEAFNEAATGAESAPDADENDQRRGMDDDELSVIIAGELTDAVRFTDLEIGFERAKATKAYRGDPYGDEEEGRSSIVSRDVHDTVQGQLPDLLRILLGPERICEYVAERPEDNGWVEQATQYAEYIVERDNDGFHVLYSAIKDALVRKTGVVKFWWDDSEEVHTEHYTGLDEMGLFLLEQDGTIESMDVAPQAPGGLALPPPPPQGVPAVPQPGNGQPPGPGGPQGAPQPPPPPQLFDVTVRRRIRHGRVRLAALPPEEFVIDRRARGLDDFTLCGHRAMKTVSELVAMGYDEEMVRQFVTSPELDTNVEYIERQPYARAVGSFDALNPATQRVLYVEAYAYVDYDGDGIAELRKVCTMGPAYKVVFHEPVDHVPFADFQVDPEPHTFFGLSTADKVMDIQRIKTHVQRNLLDSLAQSIHPRTTIVEGQVNVDDVLNNEVGGVIRQRAPGMVQPLDTPFVGQQALPVLDYVDSVREMRTGVSRQSLGLDADALQSTNQLAIQQSISGSQGKVELIARVMANGMRKLYRGILHLVVQNQDRPRIIQLAGGFVPIDPRTWRADVAVKINVALGAGTTEQRLASLQAIIAKQELILQTMGMNQPIVAPAQYANALRKWVELSGWRNADQFFSAVPPGWQPPPPPPPPPDPRIQLAQQQLQLEQQKIEFERQKALWAEHRERDKNVSDAIIRTKEMQLRYKGALDTAAVNAAAGLRKQMAQAEHAHHTEELRQNAESDRQLLGHIADAAQAEAQQAAQVANPSPDDNGGSPQ